MLYMKRRISTEEIEDIPTLLQAADDCIKVARRNRKSLTGSSFYAKKFNALAAKSFVLRSELFSRFGALEDATALGAVEEIAELLDLYFNADGPDLNRSGIRNRIDFLYSAVIVPTLSSTAPHDPTDDLFPLKIVEHTRDYIEKIAIQACGCYDQGWFDACAVMIRRLLETLVIECFEHHKIGHKIQNNNGDYLYLRDLVTSFLSEPNWNVGRNVKSGLPKIKDIGDFSAHSRRFTAKKADIDKYQIEIRTAIEEMVHIAGFDKHK
jgi:hypothetical protein